MQAAEYWVKSGRAESENRVEEWFDYLQQQETYALKDQYKKVVAQVRSCSMLIRSRSSTTWPPHTQMPNLFQNTC